MPNRSWDWFNQAMRDLEQAEDSRKAERHEWACFAAQQAAEKAAKALHLYLGQEAWGHVIARLLQELPGTVSVPADLIEKGRVLDNFYHKTLRRWCFTSLLVIRILMLMAHLSSTLDLCKVGRRFNMPVRLLSSSVLKWPDSEAVKKALRSWVEKVVQERRDLLRIGYFGSYARGDWGVGSDLDLVIVVESSEQPFERRSVEWDATLLPVPADILVYTKDEWQKLPRQGRFYQTIERETVWVYEKEKFGYHHDF